MDKDSMRIVLLTSLKDAADKIGGTTKEQICSLIATSNFNALSSIDYRENENKILCTIVTSFDHGTQLFCCSSDEVPYFQIAVSSSLNGDNMYASKEQEEKDKTTTSSIITRPQGIIELSHTTCSNDSAELIVYGRQIIIGRTHSTITVTKKASHDVLIYKMTYFENKGEITGGFFEYYTKGSSTQSQEVKIRVDFSSSDVNITRYSHHHTGPISITPLEFKCLEKDVYAAYLDAIKDELNPFSIEQQIVSSIESLNGVSPIELHNNLLTKKMDDIRSVTVSEPFKPYTLM